LLFRAYPADQVAEPSGIYSADLLDEDVGFLAQDLDFGAKRSWPGAARCRRYQHNRPRQQLIGLNYDTESASALLVARPGRRAERVNVTPQHEDSP
jgi:hypothetical protein